MLLAAFLIHRTLPLLAVLLWAAYCLIARGPLLRECSLLAASCATTHWAANGREAA
ncbi:hypothetical protein Dimus_030883, partial [Dionaea muscipula]